MPSSATTSWPTAIRTARAATVAASSITAPGSVRGTSDPSARYARSAKHSATVRRPRASAAATGLTRQAEDAQARVVGAHGLDYRRGLGLVPDHRVVERPVRLDVADPAAGDAGEGVQRAELVEHVGGQVVGGDVDEPATEPGQVAVADLGPDAHAAFGGQRRRCGAGSAGRRRGSRRPRWRW